jgi:hypothetical protein
MHPGGGTGLGKASTPSMEDVVQPHDRLEEMLHALTGKVGSLAARVSDINQRQHALNLALIRLEPGMPSGESSADVDSLDVSNNSGLAVGDVLCAGDDGLLAIGEVDDLHVVDSNSQHMGGGDDNLRESGRGALRVIDGGDDLHMIGGDGAPTAEAAAGR